MGRQDIFDLYDSCTLCPRECGVNRNRGEQGYCRAGGQSVAIGAICAHHGEEPVISGKGGICNVFFMHCNLQCSYCQNIQISHNETPLAGYTAGINEISLKIKAQIDTGCHAVGFVSPTHYVPHMMAIIETIHQWGYHVPVVYNTNAYDKPEVLQLLEGYADIFLPDFKYGIAETGRLLSQADHYPEVALNAIKEMYRQKGSTLLTNGRGEAESGLIIRHLVIPGQIPNSLKVLETIATEISVKVNISLMSQYNPAYCRSGEPAMQRTLTPEEYQEVTEAFHKLGFYRGWIQELNSYGFYNPDFDSDTPFGEA